MSKIPSQPEPLHCVIADDVRMIREQLGQWMVELGFSVTHAACGATALAAIRQSHPAIVITDIDMPHFSGMHLLQTLRQDPDESIAKIPVIVSSSLKDASVNRMIEHFGASVFLSKPMSKKRLIACVTSLLAGQQVKSDIAHDSIHQISPRFRRILSAFPEDH